MNDQNLNELFPIRALAEQTAIGSSTLRAWERRYGLLKPHRTPKGHRLYSQSDVVRVRKIVELLEDGHSHKDIADIFRMEEDVSAIDSHKKAIGSSTHDDWSDFITRTLAANSDFNIERIDAIYNEALAIYPEAMVTEQLILPLLETLGNKWQLEVDRGIAEEHFYTSWLKNRLSARLHNAYAEAKGVKVICACLPGNYHEIGLLLFALSLLAQGYRVLYFGANLPIEQLTYITQRSAAKGIILSANKSQQMSDIIKSFATKPTVPIFIGGQDFKQNDLSALEDIGITALGANLSVAIKILSTKLPAYNAKHRYPTL